MMEFSGLPAINSKTRPRVRAGLRPVRLVAAIGYGLGGYFPAFPKFKFKFLLGVIRQSPIFILNGWLNPKKRGRHVLNSALLFPPLEPFGERLKGLGLGCPEDFRNLAAVLDASHGDDMEDERAHLQTMFSRFEVGPPRRRRGPPAESCQFR